MPRVSFVTPCHNCSAFVGPMLESVAAPTISDWEHVVVDDGSTDDSADRIAAVARRDARIRLVRQERAGVARARNVGYAAASAGSEHLLFLDADDLLEPRMLERLGGYLDVHPNEGLVHCPPLLIDEAGRLHEDQHWPGRFAPAGAPWLVRRLPSDVARTPRASVYALAGLIPSVSLLRRSIYDLTPGWDEDFGQPCEDTDLFLWIGLHSEIHRVPEPLASHRLHDEQSVADDDRLERQRTRLHEKWRMLAAQPGGPGEEVEEAERLVLRLSFVNGLRGAARHLRSGRVHKAVRFAAGAVRRHAGPLLPRRNPIVQPPPR